MSVFWGIEVKPGKPYKHSVSDDDLLEGSTLHLSQATLGLEGKSKERSVVKCKVGEGPELLLCSLIPNVSESCSLDLLFDEDVTFSVVGTTSVHLIGYYMPLEDDENEDDDYTFSSEEDSEEEDEEDEDNSEMEDDEDRVPSGVKIEEIDEEMPSPSPVKLLKGSEVSKTAQKKRKKQVEEAAKAKPGEQSKKVEEPAKAAAVVSGEESEDEDGFAKQTPLKKQAIEGADGAATPVAATPGSAPDSGKKKKKKKNKNKNKEQQSPGASTPTPSAEPAKEEKQEDKKEKSVENGADKTPTPVTNGATPAKAEKKSEKKRNLVVKKFPNGLELHEVSMGKPDAKQAKNNTRVGMIYTGKLKSTGKIFDSNVGKKPFEFRLGVGEVIKGWDVGVNGMRVGDKRKLVIPPEMGYGAKGVPGTIPGNATLEFDVELVHVR
ncbi:hypothetical protein R1sor_021555 [Riccia sorocarpa]|uniref:FK506-binding protein n=1 Tax=Riccia sorocarpa TaxID=122646 RepID=A0ABD3GJJ2_9MARC